MRVKKRKERLGRIFVLLQLISAFPFLIDSFTPPSSPWFHQRARHLGRASRPLTRHEDRVSVGSSSSFPSFVVEDDEKETEGGSHRRNQAEHSSRVAEILADDDEEFRNARKQTRWGKFANVSNIEEIQKVLEQERIRVKEEQQIKIELATSRGVSFEVLEPPSEPEDPLLQPSDNRQIGLKSMSKSWFVDIDEELQNEWKALAGIDKNTNRAAVESVATDVQLEESSGQLVVREALAGVRVGSAGGWTLEVFPGDFVVHRKFGIGRFQCTCLRPRTKLTADEKKAQKERRSEILSKEVKNIKGPVTPELLQQIRSKFGTVTDMDPLSNPQTTVLEIAYADAVVHVPVDRAYRLSRYRGGGAKVKPKLSRVRGGSWVRARQKVEESTQQLAQKVLALYAARETFTRPPFDPAVEYKVKHFENSFRFQPTVDQAKCFDDVENDMVWRNRPMDRLICGDVGFGKTEVALRALFRACVNAKQAAFLAPTGVLAAQHFKNVVSRMKPYGIKVAMLRGGMSKAATETKKRIANGDVQLIVGTHALLSKGIAFRNLALLVVDEEQRFGVKQKERLKMISNGIDVLTLTATPIPRTLQMSLCGVRDTSTIKSPPPMRRPTITYVQELSEECVKEAIERELSRGGQCFYVVPRISMLADAEILIKRLFPDIRLVQAHGKMRQGGAEENVALFAEGGYDVLLATTVIENGVDIPRVNTIIVESSQSFGMSTLYQLKGRVGRSDKQGYAYFLHKEKSITEQAVQRLHAIGELSELGSGFDVANRDLEIRGAGSLLGTEQSGMAQKVGFDLYMRMLKESIRRLQGLDLALVLRTNVLFETVCEPGTFSIPEKYMPDEYVRKTEENRVRLADNTAALVNITSYWKAQFGDLPLPLQKQLKVMHLHACTRRLGIDLIGVVENADGGHQCLLRSPGLRPRHWVMILSKLANNAPPKGLDVVFPARFTASGAEEHIAGGKTVNITRLYTDRLLSNDHEDEEWEATVQEEADALHEISSAKNVKNLADVNLELYPRLIISNFDVHGTNGVNHVLKLLLPITKVVFDVQKNQVEQAMAASELHEKHEMMRTRLEAPYSQM